MIKVNDIIINTMKFPDGTPLFNGNFVNSSKGNKVNILWKFENSEELVTLIFITKHLRFNGITHICLQMPYIPNARQDRVKSEKDVFTLKYFAEIINELRFDMVQVFDPHSPVSEALIDNIKVNRGTYFINKLIETFPTPPVIYYPDNGAYKKYSDFVKIPACYGVKNRDWSNGKILGLDVITHGIDVKGKTILMIDDIISFGGSMYYGAKKLKKLGCGDIYIYASHVENSILKGDLIRSGLFKEIYTTNSIFTGNHKLIHVEDIENILNEEEI